MLNWMKSVVYGVMMMMYRAILLVQHLVCLWLEDNIAEAIAYQILEAADYRVQGQPLQYVAGKGFRKEMLQG
jgi:hypothetical protein